MRRRFLWYLVILLVAGCAGAPPDTPATPDPTVTLAAAAPAIGATPTIAPTEVAVEVLQAVAEAALGIETEEAPAEAPVGVAPAAFITVTVQPGDTLLGLAMEHNVPMAAIQLQNELGSSTVVRLGQALVIPPRSAWEGASMFWTVHVVSAGETLSQIAQVYGLTVAQLQGTNGLADADRLSIGQTLVLPLNDFVVARAAEPPPAPAPTLAPTTTPAVVAGAADDPGPGDPAPTAAPAPPAVAAPPPADLNAWPHEVARIMNEVRASHGLPPLTYNETLAQAAQIQANDCSVRRSCSHTGSDGSTIKDRVLRVGYSPASWAECWAIRPSPQGAIDIWMNETPPNDPHRRTLLTTWLTEIGIGVAPGPWNATYVIAVFGRPLR